MCQRSLGTCSFLYTSLRVSHVYKFDILPPETEPNSPPLECELDVGEVLILDRMRRKPWCQTAGRGGHDRHVAPISRDTKLFQQPHRKAHTLRNRGHLPAAPSLTPLTRMSAGTSSSRPGLAFTQGSLG